MGLRAAAVGAEVGGVLLSEDIGRGGPIERGEAPSGGSTRDGDAERGGALNGWKDTDERLAWLPSLARAPVRPPPPEPILAVGRGL